MSKIVKLTSTNYKRLKAVEIQPAEDGHLVIVAGRNGQGKSSVLDSITAALGGVNTKTTPQPIRSGEDRAEIVLETEDLIVTRKFTATGSNLTVKSRDGATYSKGQARLDDLLGKLSLDPLAFTHLSDRDQLATLLNLVDLPFAPEELDAERKSVFDQRTDVNRTLKDLTSQAAQYGDFNAEARQEEVSVSELLAQYREGEALNAKIAAAEDAVGKWASEVERLKAELEAAEQQHKMAVGHAKGAPAPVNLEAIQSQIDNAETTNQEARRYKEWENIVTRRDATQAESDALTVKLAEIDKRKSDGLAAATFPVDGLGFSDGGVTYREVPFKQASSAEQLRISLAMAIALNPELRVIRIADGSLLDAENLALIESMAREQDYQVWIEVVGDGDGSGVVIEDGAVAV